MKKAVFLDRDGTINVEKDYLHKIEDFEFEDGSLEAIRIFTELGYEVIVVTNQSGIARGYYTERDLERLNSYMEEKVEEYGGKITDCFYCPHHPEKGLEGYKMECSCRKPNPQMLLDAIERYDIDVEKSYMVGDKISDIEAGKSAGVQSILVKTGYGEKTLKKTEIDVPIYKNLLEFAQTLLK